MQWGEGEGLGLHGGGIEEVAEVAQAAFCPDDAVEGLEHHFITRLVEEELDADILRTLDIDELAVVGDSDDHAVAIDVRDGGGEGEIADGISG